MDCLSPAISHCGRVSSVKQKNFKQVPVAVIAEWDSFLLRCRTNDEHAGPIAVWLAARMKPTEWAKAIEAYNEFMESKGVSAAIKHEPIDGATESTTSQRKKGRG